jgi:F-type H+-transporting ATPase subunit b
MLRAFLVEVAAEEEAINPLLPELYDIVWSAVIFVALLLVIGIFVVPRLNKSLDARADAIEGGLKRAEEAQAEAAATKGEYESQLNEARVEAGRIREQARAEGVAIVNEAKEQASVEAARIAANAQLQIEAERTAALVSLRAEVGSLALDLASGVIGEALNDDKKSTALVDRFLADLESSSTSKVK